MFSGILCISPPHLQIGDSVSIVADVRGKCLRGSKTFSGDLCHVGEGVLNVTRDEIFRNDVTVTGVGVTVTKKMFPCPSLNESSFSGMFLLQNLPSIIAVDILSMRHDTIWIFFISCQTPCQERECWTCALPRGGRQPTSQRE